jgi:hypothetical protein
MAAPFFRNCDRHGVEGAGVGLASEGDKVKIVVAKRLRKETMMTLKWIASRLQMGSWAHLAHLLYRQK